MRYDCRVAVTGPLQVDAADRDPRALDHLVLGQRPRDHLPRPGARAGRAGARRAVPGARRALVRRRTATCPIRPTAERSSTTAGRLKSASPATVRDADLVIVGSYVPEGVAVGEWVTGDGAGRDGLLRHRHAGHAGQAGARRPRVPVAGADPALRPLSVLHRRPDAASGWSASSARPARGRSIAPSIPSSIIPEPPRAALGPGLHGHLQRRPPAAAGRLLLEPARRWPEGRFVVAGPQYPETIRWPANVERIEHLPPGRAPRASTTRSGSRSTSRAPT